MAEDLQNAQNRLRLDQMDESIAALEGKAATPGHLLALLDARMAALGARLALAKGGRMEGK